jgi:hypothetical protein
MKHETVERSSSACWGHAKKEHGLCDWKFPPPPPLYLNYTLLFRQPEGNPERKQEVVAVGR